MGVAVVPINTVMVEVLTLVVAAVEKDLLVRIWWWIRYRNLRYPVS